MPQPNRATSNPALPYGRQQIDEADIAAVVEALRAPLITTGPLVERFECAFAASCGSKYAVAVSSGTAALHAAMFSLGIGPGDEVIVPPLTFAATANAVVYQGGTPVFADIDPDTLLVDPDAIAALISPRTKAIVAVDYAGQPCDYDALCALAELNDLPLVADACHAAGASYRGRPVGSLADLNAFSFHPVKHMTTGEGGMITTDDAGLAERMRRFRNHGIDIDAHARAARGDWFYAQTELGYNYRITDFQCALGLSQLGKLPGWVARRRALAAQYDALLEDVDGVTPLATRGDNLHAYHLYVVRFDAAVDRSEIFTAMRAAGIGVNVHYIPVHLHPLYQQRFACRIGDCPVAETAYEHILSLPIFPAMADGDPERVVRALRTAIPRARQTEVAP